MGRLLLALALANGACSAPPADRAPRLGLALSALPDLGLEGSFDWRVAELARGDLRAELHGAQQFLDDEDFADDGNSSAGDWTQAGLGLRWIATPVAEGSWEWIAGLVWFEARGEPNLIELPGHYLGLRFGFGYRVRLTPSIDLGPELVGILAQGEGDCVLVPQLVWGLRVRL